jgi:hypothetical protein
MHAITLKLRTYPYWYFILTIQMVLVLGSFKTDEVSPSVEEQGIFINQVFSFSRTTDGASTWKTFSTPTPGQSNT